MILTELRARTRPYHDRLEASGDVLEQCGNLVDYRQLLECFYGFYRPVEAFLERHRFAPEFGFEGRRKTPLLLQDLQALPGQALPDLPLCRRLPDLSRPAHALGCAYVLEGATLGGQIIARHLRATLGLCPATGAAFFNSYQKDVGWQWKQFCAALTRHAAQTSDEEDIILGACDTFETLACWLSISAALPQAREF